MRLELRDLRLVVAVADFGTLTRAGQHIHLTQSALSHQLSDLEQRLGTALFHRSGRRMVPTRVGEQLASRARETLRQLHEVERDVVNMAAGREAVLRLATECYTAYHWLPPVLKNFGRDYPNVEVKIVPEATSNPIRALLAGTIDLCILSGSDIRDRRVTTIPLFKDELVVVVPVDHAFAGREFVDPAELRDERIMLYSPTEQSYIFRHILAPAGVSQRQTSQISLTEAMLELAKAGMGIAVLARWAVEPYVRAGSLCAVPLTGNGVIRQWRVAVRSVKSVPQYVTDFVEHIGFAMSGPPKTKPLLTLQRSPASARTKRKSAG